MEPNNNLFLIVAIVKKIFVIVKHINPLFCFKTVYNRLKIDFFFRALIFNMGQLIVVSVYETKCNFLHTVFLRFPLQSQYFIFDNF